MSKHWEAAIIQKVDELLYDIIMGEEEQISNPKFSLMLLYLTMRIKYLTMRIKYQKEENYNQNEEELQKLLLEIHEFQKEHEEFFQKILKESK
ncbi:hypothetical protein ACQKCU_20190 [Heyndrickxia sporothermodurans]